MVSQANRGFNSFHHLSPFSALSWSPKLVNRAISVPRILTINLPVEGQPPLRRESIGRGPLESLAMGDEFKAPLLKEDNTRKGDRALPMIASFENTEHQKGDSKDRKL